MYLRYSKRWLFPLTAIFVLLSPLGEVSPAGASPAVATIQKVSGTATVVRQGRSLTASAGFEVQEDDTLRTGPDGSLGVIFKDDTVLSLGPESVLVVDEFVFAPKQGKFSIVLRMLKGTAGYLSGLISKLSPESAHFETPTASIGIRGTQFVVRVEGR